MNLHGRNTARMDIECPGDTILYRCGISPNGVMSWRVTMPEEMPASVTFNSNNRQDTLMLSEHISAYVSAISSIFIVSIIELTVFPGISTDQVMLECFNENVHESIFVTINTAC